MSALRTEFVHQFGNPQGPLGRVAGLIMAVRPSNRERNFRTLELLNIRPDDQVLEVGFGPGLSIERALQLATHGRVFGIDRSKLMVRAASHRNRRAVATGRAQLMIGSAEALPEFPTGFDKAFAVNVYMFWTDPVAVLRGLHRVMNAVGMIALTTQPRNRGASVKDTEQVADRMTAALRQADFENVRTEILDMKPVPAACVLGVVKTLDR